jgi:hypothetical protein
MEYDKDRVDEMILALLYLTNSHHHLVSAFSHQTHLRSGVKSTRRWKRRSMSRIIRIEAE